MSKLIWKVVRILRFPLLIKIYETRGTAGEITLRTWFFQKILGFNRSAYWPVHHSSVVTHSNNIKIGEGTAPGLSNSCYIQGSGGIEIGDYTIIAPGVGVISSNHDIHDYKVNVPGTIKIGNYCWLGMNATILPGVVIGDHTIVAAGAVVKEPFEEGYAIVGGVPARVLKRLKTEECKKSVNKYPYYGYLRPHEFQKRFEAK